MAWCMVKTKGGYEMRNKANDLGDLQGDLATFIFTNTYSKVKYFSTESKRNDYLKHFSVKGYSLAKLDGVYLAIWY